MDDPNATVDQIMRTLKTEREYQRVIVDTPVEKSRSFESFARINGLKDL